MPSGELEPKLVELQAFPSLYGYQATAAHQYVESYGLRPILVFISTDLTAIRTGSCWAG